MEEKFALPRIQRLREENNWSKNELAQKIGISPSAMGNYENGDRIPDARVIVNLARTFGVSTDYLLGLSMLREADIQLMSNATGLWDAALKVMIDNKYDIDFLNKLLVSDLFPSFLKEGTKYSDSYESGAYDDLLIRLMEESEDDFTKQRLKSLLDVVRNDEIKQHGSEPVINIFKKILEKMIHTYYFIFPAERKYKADQLLYDIKGSTSNEYRKTETEISKDEQEED